VSSEAADAWGAVSSVVGEGSSPAVVVVAPAEVAAPALVGLGFAVVAPAPGLTPAPGLPVDGVDPVAVAPEVLRGVAALVPPDALPPTLPPVAVERGVVARGVLDGLDDGLGVELGVGLGFGVDEAVGAGGALLGAPPEPNANPITVPGAGS